MAQPEKGHWGVSVMYPNRGWCNSRQGTTAKSDGKFENPLRKLKEHKGNYKLKADNRTLCAEKFKKCLHIHSVYLRSVMHKSIWQTVTESRQDR